MQSQLQESCKLAFALVAAAALALTGVACSRGPDAPHVRGSWTGRLVPVVVRDAKDREYAALGLRIEDGPRTLRSTFTRPPTVWDVPEGEVALLNRTGTLIVSPTEVAAPIGSRVRIDGLMMYMGMGAIAEEADGWRHYKPIVSRKPYDTGGDLMLSMRAPPKLIDPPADGKCLPSR